MSDSEDGPMPLMSYHDNRVTYKVIHAEKARYTLESCKFTITDFSITSGQDPEGRIVKDKPRIWYGNSEGYFSFEVGRKGTSGPADFWSRTFSSSENTFGHQPNELNFAFTGPLDMEVSEIVGGEVGPKKTYKIATYGLAQGKSGSSNNWWVGCKGGYAKSGNKLTCEGVSSSTGQKLYFTFRRGGNNNEAVDITNINPNPY